MFLNNVGKPQLYNSKDLIFLYNAKTFSQYSNSNVDIIDGPITVADSRYLLVNT